MSTIGIGTSKRVLLSVALAGAVAFAQPVAALAAHGGGGGGGFHGGGFGGVHGGGFGGFHAGGFHGSGFHGGFGGHRHFGVFGLGWGGGLGWGAYADPDLYGWDGDYAGSGDSQPYASQYWYYCRNPAGYYPYVTQCSVAWQPVPAG